MIITYYLLIKFFFSFYNQEQEGIKIVDYDEIVSIINTQNDKTKVLNFWATWCGPCVEEMHLFKNAMNKVSSEDFEFYFISLDDPNDKNKANSLMAKYGFSKNLYLINNLDFNAWIDKIESKWSGSIPMTLVISKNNKGKYFKESNFVSVQQLQNFLNKSNSHEKN